MLFDRPIQFPLPLGFTTYPQGIIKTPKLLFTNFTTTLTTTPLPKHHLTHRCRPTKPIQPLQNRPRLHRNHLTTPKLPYSTTPKTTLPTTKPTTPPPKFTPTTPTNKPYLARNHLTCQKKKERRERGGAGATMPCGRGRGRRVDG